MKALILTMTSGEGHNNIARTLCNQLAQTGIESETIDIFAHNELEYKFNNMGYLFACSHFPKTYDYFWKKLKFRKSEKRYRGVAQREVEKVSDFVRKKAERANADFFLCVHPYCAILCDFWKRKGYFADKKVIAILTDILPHPLWESAIRCDYVIVPTRHSLQQLENKGFDEKQIVVGAYPVRAEFTQVLDKAEIRQKLGLQNKFTVLILSGGYGIGKNYKVARQLLKSDVQILCVNGRNKHAFAQTQKLAEQHPEFCLKNFGFVNNLDELMSAADLVVSRGGAGSLFEAMSKQLPVIVRENPIINERENAEILQNEGVAVKLQSLSQIAAIVEDFRQNPKKAQYAQAKCCQLTQRKCVKDVCQTIVNLL